MKCPNCGAEMKDGLLYCEKCGEDIHIVPDFEPEIEHNIEQNIKNVLNDAELDGQKAALKTVGWQSKTGWISGISICVILLIVGFVLGYRHYSPEYQSKRAMSYCDTEEYDKAIQCYKRAIELDGHNVDYKLGLVQVYFLKNDKENYEYWLHEIVLEPEADFEQLESAYGKLIAIYRAKSDYKTINELLKECTNQDILETYQSYLVMEPIFSVPEGSYEEVKVLKLTGQGKGIIYYTMDGSEPDATKIQYVTPILLENGVYNIRAVFINENDVSSEIVSAKYDIYVSALEIPEINYDSGEYDVPLCIEVTNSMQDIYYTTDGSMPTLTSRLYTGPIPMPLGVSSFRFARIQNGRRSEVVDRVYTFDFSAEFSAAQAVDLVREKNLEWGKIIDNSGHFDDTFACYQYQYLYVYNLFDESVVYMIAEVLVDPEGVQNQTGNYFAVNAYTGQLYQLYKENGAFVLASE